MKRSAEEPTDRPLLQISLEERVRLSDASRMSLKRRVYECRRLFRHQSVQFVAFAAGILFVIFVLASYGDTDEERSSEHLHHGGGRAARSDVELNGELPGGADPDTVLTQKLGNFEVREEVDTGAPGDYGKPVHVDSNKHEVQRAFSEFGFNTYVSDMIAMNRSLPDVRMEECKYWHYPEDLPTASVVIAFHNEGWSPLLRTVHSVILRSDLRYLKEIILVDDFSDKEHLKERLETYIQQFNGIVKLIRNKEREGLIRTRTNGALAATSEVVIFLDAHCEVNRNWLVPLLAPIRRNRKVMTVPVIDGIDMTTWEYRRVYGAADVHFRGIFEWGLLYKETEISPEEKAARTHHSQPFRSPTHAGGLFAIDKAWFAELGYYDPGLQIWGGEQYELSFKIWMCGGGILFVPCSHVGHVYRNHMPYGFGKLSGKPVISTNMMRVIKTWMDDYDKYYYIREPQAGRRDPGDISAQLAIRERLQCKSFDWYMKNVAYDVVRSYPLLPDNDVWGNAKNPKSGKCIDTMGRAIPGTVGATPCHSYGGNQLIRLNKKGQLAQGEWCITPQGDVVRTGHCRKGTVNGNFRYDRNTKQVINFRTNTCLTADEEPSKSDLKLITCDEDNEYQKWEWTEFYSN
uniref:Polypeptide N-acetylgalactosaminyltransferase n=1 Tax=Panagrellus redivivus TaxID=6233 RepID=A0A7E4W324_PANRE